MEGTKKKPFRFSANQEIILLREVLANDPYASSVPGKEWDNIAIASELKVLSGRRCRERTSLLLSYYRKEDADLCVKEVLVHAGLAMFNFVRISKYLKPYIY